MRPIPASPLVHAAGVTVFSMRSPSRRTSTRSAFAGRLTNHALHDLRPTVDRLLVNAQDFVSRTQSGSGGGTVRVDLAEHRRQARAVKTEAQPVERVALPARAAHRRDIKAADGDLVARLITSRST
jgi:hypothetical protein